MFLPELVILACQRLATLQLGSFVVSAVDSENKASQQLQGDCDLEHLVASSSSGSILGEKGEANDCFVETDLPPHHHHQEATEPKAPPYIGAGVPMRYFEDASAGAMSKREKASREVLKPTTSYLTVPSHDSTLLPSRSSQFFHSRTGSLSSFTTSTPAVRPNKHRPTASYSSRTLYHRHQYPDININRTPDAPRVERRSKHPPPTTCSFFSNPFLENADTTRDLWRKRLEVARRNPRPMTPSRATELKNKATYLRTMHYIEGVQFDVPSDFDQYMFLLRLQQGQGGDDIQMIPRKDDSADYEHSDDYGVSPGGYRSDETEDSHSSRNDLHDPGYNHPPSSNDLDYTLFKQLLTMNATNGRGRARRHAFA